MSAKRVVFLCGGNSCRSQMAEAWLKRLGGERFETHSAGTSTQGIHPLTVAVMTEAGVDLAGQWSKAVDALDGMEFDLAVTLCGDAHDDCPVPPGRAAARVHWDVPDPAAVEGSEEERLEAFRRVREELRAKVETLVAASEASMRAQSPERAFLFWLLPLLATALAYASVLWAGLVWDDAFVQTRQLSYFTSPLDAFVPPAGAPYLPTQYYRPLVFLSFLADHAAARALLPTGASPAPVLHATNLTLHLAATALLFALTLRLVPGPRRHVAAALAAAFFGLHPVHVESVASVAGRTDILATVFLLAGLWCATRHTGAKTRGWALASGFLLFPALLAKENAAAYVALLPLFLWAWDTSQGLKLPPSARLRRLALPLGAAALALAAYFALRLNAGIHLLWDATPLTPSPAQALFRAAGYGALKSLIPWPHNPYVATLPSLGAALGVLGVAVLALGWAVKRGGLARETAFFAAAWFLATLAPSLLLAIKPLSPTLSAERYLYVPGVAVAALFGMGLTRIPETWRKQSWVAAGALLVAFGGGTAVQALHWRDDVSFWRHAASVDGNGDRIGVATAWGEALRGAGRYEEGEAVLQRALDAQGLVAAPTPERVALMRNLATLRFSRAGAELAAGRAPRALADLDAGLALLGSIPPPLGEDAALIALAGAGLCLKDEALTASSGRSDPSLLARAEDLLRRAVHADPANPDYAANLLECRRRMERARR